MGFLQTVVVTLTLSANPGGETVLLDFYTDRCGYCQQMRPAVDRLLAMGYPVRRVYFNQNQALGVSYGVDRFPTFIMLVDGRVVARVVGATSFERLEQMCKLGTGSRPPSQALKSPPRRIATLPDFQNHGSQNDSSKPRVSDDQFIAVTVRLRIRDAIGHSGGSGTIIDVRDGAALILTCGHIFRDAQNIDPTNPKAVIEVDVFGPTPAQNIPGELVVYDLELDLGLVAIRAPGPLASIRVAPPKYPISLDDRVINVGCNDGDAPSVRHSRITAVDKYFGPSNIEVRGTPAEGRSGGGLFSQDGYVIGVCNAADPDENEGLYAALESIHALLDRRKLSFVYRANDAAVRLASSELPSMPSKMPSSLGAPLPENNPPEGPVAPEAHSLSLVGMESLPPIAVPDEIVVSEERAALDEIRRRRAEGAEVICVIRSLTDPKAPSEILVLDRALPGLLRQLAIGEAEVICVIRSRADLEALSEILVLDRASPGFLRQLAAEAKSPSTPHLTSLKVPARTERLSGSPTRKQ